MATKVKTLKIQGVDKAIRDLNSRINRMKNVTATGVKKGSLWVERVSKQQVPVQPIGGGNLKGSFFNNPVNTEKGPGREIGYATAYARRQHEELSYRHTTGKAKYLEDPINSEADTVVEIIREEGKKAMK